jgi:antirestriction protein ArdC
MSMPRKLGTLSPVIYFVNADGHILLAPYSDFPTPASYERREAGSLPEIDRLVERMRAQELRIIEQEHMAEAERAERVHAAVRDRLYAKLVSAATNTMEADFIRAYLELREEKHRKKYHAKYEAYNVYLHAREFDLHGRDAASEKWKG